MFFQDAAGDHDHGALAVKRLDLPGVHVGQLVDLSRGRPGRADCSEQQQNQCRPEARDIPAEAGPDLFAGGSVRTDMGGLIRPRRARHAVIFMTATTVAAFVPMCRMPPV